MASTWSLSSVQSAFKIKYGKLADRVFNAGNPILMQIESVEDFVGSQITDENPLGFSGSVGSRKLPKAGVGNYKNSVLTSKKLYARVVVDRESMKASSTTEGAFFKFMDKPVKDTMESFDRNRSRMFFNDGSGILGKGNAAAADVTGLGSEASPYLVNFVAAEFFEQNWEERDYVQVVSGITDAVTGGGGVAEGVDTETNLLEVVSVDAVARTIGLVGTSAVLAALVVATNPLPADGAIVMQRSYMGDMIGLRLLSKASIAHDAGTVVDIYGIPTFRRWKMFTKSAAGGAITSALCNEVAIGVEAKTGKTINLIGTSYTQFGKFLDLSENQKRYTTVTPANPSYNKAQFGFKAVEYMTSTGPVAVIPDRMIHKDEVWFLNKNYIQFRLRPGGAEWFTEDGTTFLRISGEDEYEARYGTYGECFISPSFQGHLYNLAS
jgi:hypothetical protein